MPETLPRIANPGDPIVRENLGRETIIAEAPPRDGFHCYGNVLLIRRARGYYCAGSMMRLDEPDIGVRFYDRSGCSNGRSFRDTPEGEAEARALFAKWTKGA